VRAFTISAFGSVTYYVGIGYVPVFLVAVAGLPEGRALQLASVASVAVILVTSVVGWLHYRVGRRTVLLASALVSAVVPLLTFSVMARGGGGSRCAGRWRCWPAP
jgi:MHS family proline/betaine transporter-like MFS transporter